MTDLEIKLHEILVQLIVRYPDGWTRILDALAAVHEVGLEMKLQEINDTDQIYH
jgi:hypothetical protein